MKKVVFIRHGESESNAGERTRHPQSINLTLKGRQEADAKAAAFTGHPDLIVTSSYIRTKQTAEPFLKKFDDVPVAEWDIQEFTFLSAEKYKDTTNAERMPFLEEYWKRADPFYKDCDTAESFAEFVKRCKDTVEQMKKCDGDLTLAFSHGYLMNGIRFLLKGGFEKIDSDTMRDFWNYHSTHKIENCATMEFDVEGDKVTLAATPKPVTPKKPFRPFILD